MNIVRIPLIRQQKLMKIKIIFLRLKIKCEKIFLTV